MASVFFSYSHHDEALRDELEIHLKPLQREGLIDSWHDRRIIAGDDFHNAISEKLEAADVILLLVSPYFLASDYCHNIEMQRAMQKHAEKSARVIPVILEFCDWHHSLFGKLLAVPPDGKPVSKYPNRHEAFLEVAHAIRRALADKPASPPRRVGPENPTVLLKESTIRPDVRSSNLRIKKSFSDQHRDAFLEEAFEYIATFFENSLLELQQRHAEITTRFRRVDGNHFSAFVYVNGATKSQCSIRQGDRLSGGILYSSEPGATNSWNEQLSVADNGTSLFLRSMGMTTFGANRESELSLQGAAEELWSILVRPLQQ